MPLTMFGLNNKEGIMRTDEVFANLKKRIEQGGVTDETIKKIVEQYFEKNPVQVITDNTLSVAGTPADALATGTAIDSLKEDIDDLIGGSYEYIEKEADEVNQGLVNLANKSLFEDVNSCYTKTSVQNIKRIKVTGRSSSATYSFDLGAFYTSDDTLISKFGNDNDTFYENLEVDVPSNASYVLVNQKNIKSSDYYKIKVYAINDLGGRTKTLENRANMLENRANMLENRANMLESDFADKFNNILSFSSGGYIRQTGVFVQDDNGYNTGYILVNGYDTVVAHTKGSAGFIYVIAFFDQNKNFLTEGSMLSVSNTNNYTATIPTDAFYVMVSGWSDIQFDFSAYLKKSTTEKTIDEQISDIDVRISALEDNSTHLLDDSEFALFRKWGLIGDSLSVGHTVSSDGNTTSGRNIYYSWGQYLARRIGNTCLNFGKSGISAKSWMSDALCYTRLLEPNNLCQAYIIALGANDTSFDIGTIDDVNFEDMSQNAETEYGYYAKVINAVRTVSANAPIFLFTLPYPRNGDTRIQAINKMIRDFVSGGYWEKIFLVDLDADYNDYFRNGKLYNQIGNTGWHLTSLGYLYASKVNEKALSKVISDNYSQFQDVFLLPYGSTEELD